MISAAAIGPCPCPSEIAWNFLSYAFSLAKRSRLLIGSAPADMTNTSGVVLFESAKASCRSSGGISVYSRPISSAMNSAMHSTSFSGRKTLMRRSFWKVLISAHWSGSGTLHGASACSSGVHASTLAATYELIPFSASMRSLSTQSSVHCALSMPSGHGGSELSSTMPAPMRKSPHSASEIAPALRRIEVVIMNE